MQQNKTVMSIAGFDPSSGAGVTADLLVFAAHGLFGTSAITTLTVQNTLGVTASHFVSTTTLIDTLQCLEEDLPPAGIKIGVLGSAANVSAVATFLSQIRSRRPLLVVLDPVLKSSSGNNLIEEAGVEILTQELLQYVDWITPNRQELQHLTGKPVKTDQEIFQAAAALQAKRNHLNVVVTGGDSTPPVDYLFQHERSKELIPGEHICTSSTHGTGCAFSSALLCQLLLGREPLEAARAAKAYVTGALQWATPLGSGKGPMHLLWNRSGSDK